MTTGTNTKQFNQVPQYQNLMSSNGKIATPWYRFFTNLLTGVPSQDVTVVAVTTSPQTFQATVGGTLFVAGTDIQVDLSRDGQNYYPVSSGGAVPMSSGDIAKIIYTGAPEFTFFPR